MRCWGRVWFEPATKVTAAEAKNRFGSLCAQAKRKQAFEAEYASWIAAQNALVDTHGIPGADMRPW